MSLEFLINKIISLDPDAHLYLETLDKKIISLTCTDFPSTTFYAIFYADHIQLTTTKTQPIDLAISGPLHGLINLALQKQDADLRANKIQIIGDVLCAEAVQQLLFKLDIDWEEELSKYTGDIIAHQAISIIKNIKRLQQQTSRSLEAMITEYLQDESRLLPSQYEVDNFIQEVDNLRLQVDRLDAKAKIYESR